MIGRVFVFALLQATSAVLLTPSATRPALAPARSAVVAKVASKKELAEAAAAEQERQLAEILAGTETSAAPAKGKATSQCTIK